MSDIVIKVRGLGKKYHIGEQLPQRGLAGSIKNAAGLPWKMAKSIFSGKSLDKREEFWALKDVSFDVKQGEVLGIIGRNGAGKSTLLKILSRITTPTLGEIEMFGRVGCLLEVGTGFHPELTGRENVFLNGSLLGMTNVEIKKRFDEIVDFSGVERFLDTPVKFYSSGMYTRLAFSVAAHLDPEILIVDEVLAVGDAEFQKKCLGKMDSIAKSGRTIIFVSHNMSAVANLCDYGIWFDNGQIKRFGQIEDVIREYIDHQSFAVQKSMESRLDRQGSGEICFTAITTMKNEGTGIGGITSGAPVRIEIGIENKTSKDLRDLRINISVDDYMMQRVTAFSNRMTNCRVDLMAGQQGRITISIDKMPLIPGRYYINLSCEHKGIITDLIYQAGVLEVESGQFFQNQTIDEKSCNFGICMITHKMEYTKIQ